MLIVVVDPSVVVEEAGLVEEALKFNVRSVLNQAMMPVSVTIDIHP